MMRKYIFSIGVFLALAGLAEAVLVDSGLTPHRAEYRVKISVLSGRLNTELRQTKDGYIATHLIAPTGIAGAITGSGEILAESEFQDGESGIVPLRYRGNDEISSDRLRVDIVFDWDASRATGEFQTDETPAPVPVDKPLDELVHDPVSIQYELMANLANGSSETEYVLFEHDRIRTVEITRVGERRIKTGAGTFDTIGIRHQAKGSSRATTLWMAAELGYLPVMIERHRKEKLQMRAELEKYEPEST
jgi:hypothetical protein